MSGFSFERLVRLESLWLRVEGKETGCQRAACGGCWIGVRRIRLCRRAPGAAGVANGAYASGPFRGPCLRRGPPWRRGRRPLAQCAKLRGFGGSAPKDMHGGTAGRDGRSGTRVRCLGRLACECLPSHGGVAVRAANAACYPRVCFSAKRQMTDTGRGREMRSHLSNGRFGRPWKFSDARHSLRGRGEEVQRWIIGSGKVLC